MRGTRLVGRLLLPALAIAWCTPAFAQSDRELATRRDLLSQASSLSDQGSHTEALALAKRAASIKMTPSLRLFLAGEQSQLQQIADAYGNSRQCSVEAESDSRLNNRERILAACKDLEEALGKRVGRVTVTVPAGTSVKVSISGDEISSALLGEPYVVSPGKLTVTATGLGFLPFSSEVEVPEGGSTHVEVKLQVDTSSQVCPEGQERVHGACAAVAPVVTAPLVVTEPAALQTPPRDSSSRRTWSIVVGSAGILGLGVGTALGIAALVAKSAAHDECPLAMSCTPAAVRDSKATVALANGSTVGFVAGGVLLAGGVALYLTTPKGSLHKVGLRVGPRAAAFVAEF
jgi:hypothetical protein